MSNERDTSPVITQEKLLEYHNKLVYPFLNGVSTKGDQAFVPCGKIEGFMRTTAPKGYLVCDGTEYLKSAYPSLAAVLGAVDTAQSTTNFAGSDANHFKVPDLRGEFLRGTGTNSHTDQGSGGSVGVHQDATELDNIFSYYDGSIKRLGAYRVNETNLTNYANKNFDSDVISGTTAMTTDSMTTMDYPSSEGIVKGTVRPTNTSVLYCIAYEDLYLTPGHTYSTTEQVVGTWIDGKPLYEKTLSIAYNTESTRYYLDIANVDVFINASINYFTRTNGTEPHPGTQLNEENYYFTINSLRPSYEGIDTDYPNVSVLDLTVGSVENARTISFVITVQYTKTTD